jgi:hypothetical protein
MQQKGKFLLFNLSEFEQWLKGLIVSRKIQLIQNHHTLVPNYQTFKSTINKPGKNHFNLLEAMEKYHVEERGFSMIAQNLTTFPDGLIAICRPIEEIPAGIKGANSYGICIEHLGNFDTGGDAMASSHNKTIIRLNALLCKKFALPADTKHIVYHHWYDLNTGKRVKEGTGTTKSCPGNAFFKGNTVEACNQHFIPEVKRQMSL